ncbi:MAG: hypothetical protein ACRELV_06450 [Longimicrobiales bacterium]
MHRRVAWPALALMAAACGGDDPPARYIEDFAARAGEAACEPVQHPDAEREVTDLAPAGDTAILALFGTEREVVLYDGTLRPLLRLGFEAAGPRGLELPVSAAILRDRIHVVDEAGNAVKVFDLNGAYVSQVHTSFPPRHARVVGGDVLLAPIQYGSEPARLVYRIDGDSLTEVDGARPVRLPDAGWEALANMIRIVDLRAGAWGYVHGLFLPRAKLFRRDVARDIALPVPASLRPRIEARPTLPIREETAAEIPVIAFAVASESGSGDVLLLTTTGRPTSTGADGYRQRALLRLDRDLEFRKGYLVGPRATAMVPVPGGAGEVLLVDDTGAWFRCRVD